MRNLGVQILCLHGHQQRRTAGDCKAEGGSRAIAVLRGSPAQARSRGVKLVLYLHRVADFGHGAGRDSAGSAAAIFDDLVQVRGVLS